MMDSQNSNHDTQESTRIAIAAIIIASLLALWSLKLEAPRALLVPLGTVSLGLIVTGFFAFAFILGKGFELSYDQKERKLLAKVNQFLYKFAMTAYLVIPGSIFVLYLVDYLNKIAKSGNAFGAIGIILLGIAISAVLVRKDIKEIVVSLREIRKARRRPGRGRY